MSQRRFVPMTVFAAIPLVLATLSASEASAEPGGIFGRSGRTAGQTCATASCHGAGSGGSVASFALAPLDPTLPPASLGYVPGATYAVTVSVSGGPAAALGFNWDSDAGAGIVTDPLRTRRNGAASRPSEFTHSSAGRFQSAWSFQWTAPAASQAVNFWLMGNSTNNDGKETGDAPTAPVTAQLLPVPVDLLSRVGNVNAGAGNPLPVLLVNGSHGDERRVVEIPTGTTPMEVSLWAYPGAPPAIPYVVYALSRENRAADVVNIPRGVGRFSFSIPLLGGTPVTVVNRLGHESKLGAPRIPGTPLGPGKIFRLPRIPASVAGARITLQGLVPDSTAPAGVAVTNGVVVSFL